MNQFILILFALKNLTLSAPKEFKGVNRSADLKWKIERIGKLPQVIEESSGLAYYKGKIYTHGDSGNEPALYALSYPLVKGETPQKILLQQANNVDWEDLTIDTNGVIYIGDIGNNSNKRKQITIYRYSIEKQTELTPIQTSLVDLPKQPIAIGKKSFDIESLSIQDGNLLMVTKERGKHDARVYQLSNNTTTTTVIDSIPLKGMATASDVSPTDHQLYVLSYSHIYAYTYSEVDGKYIPYRKKKSAMRGQVEAFCFINDKEAVFTNERGVVFKLTIIDK